MKVEKGFAAHLLQYLVAWFAMLLVSILNGAARDLIYGKSMSGLAAHQLSTCAGIILLGIVMATFVRYFSPTSGRQALAIGVFWMTLTIAFEFIFFHFVGGHSWAELLANYNVLAGRVWVVVLLWIAVAPYIFFRVFSNR